MIGNGNLITMAIYIAIGIGIGVFVPGVAGWVRGLVSKK